MQMNSTHSRNVKSDNVKSMEGREFFWYRLRNCCYGVFFRGNLSKRNLCTRGKNVEMKEGHSCAQKSEQAECDKLGKRIRRNLCGTGRYTKAKDRKMVCKGAAVLA